MGFDYYGILNIHRNCDEHEIKKSYRRLVLRLHPNRSGNAHPASAGRAFALLGEAYEVLVDPQNRAIYDKYGEEGLKQGVPGPDHFIQPYVYHGDPYRTFQEYFGTNNPYSDSLEICELPPLFESPQGFGYKKKDDPIYQTLPLTLYEIYHGGLKKMKIQRLVFTDDKCTELELKTEILSIPIKPGVYPNTEIRFKEAGDQGPMKIPADVVFVTEDRPHSHYKRDGLSNLRMEFEATLEQALCGFMLSLDTLDGRHLNIPITNVIGPSYEKVIPGEGLPILQCPDKAKGDLVIGFKKEFPSSLTKNTRRAFRHAFNTIRATNIN